MDEISQSLLRRVEAAYGAVRVRSLQLTRTERRRLDALVAAGRLNRSRHGVVSLPGTAREVILSRVHGGLLSCETATRLLRLETPSWTGNAATHLIVPHRGCLSPLGGERLHRTRRPVPWDPTGPVVASTSQALAQFLLCSPSALSPLCAIDHALRAQRTTPERIDRYLHGIPGGAEARRRLALASPRSRSPLETAVRLDLIEAGLPFRDGVTIPHVGEVDFVIAGSIVLEADGASYHSDPEQFARDRWRDRRLTILGYHPMRVTREEVRLHRVVRDVQAALATIRARP